MKDYAITVLEEALFHQKEEFRIAEEMLRKCKRDQKLFASAKRNLPFYKKQMNVYSQRIPFLEQAIKKLTP